MESQYLFGGLHTRKKENEVASNLDAGSLPQVPDGWRWTTIGRIGQVKGGKRLPQGHNYSPTRTQYPYLRVVDFENFGIREDDLKYLTAQTHQVLIRYTISRDDVYISIAGTIGAVGLVPDHLHEAHLTENAAKVVLQSAEINPKYLCYWLASPSSKSVIAASTIATTQPKLALFRIERIPFPFAPRPVQDRIVSEIEKQFTRLDSGVAVLRRVQANLKRYLAAVLKAACEGKLVPTEADLARQEGRTYETGAQLLDRILIERRQKWNGKGKYKEPAKPDLTKPSLPDGWVCASVEQITDNFDGRRVPLKSTERDKRSGLYPYYGASGIIDDIDDYLFNGEYLLIAEDGANLLSRSTPIAFKASGKFWVNNHAHIVQTAGGIPLAYLGIFLNGQDLKFFITGSAQPKLTQAALNRIFVPLPPYSEQLRIVAEVERRLSVVEELEAVVNTSLQRATSLRQSILQRAFEGTLIP